MKSAKGSRSSSIQLESGGAKNHSIRDVFMNRPYHIFVVAAPVIAIAAIALVGCNQPVATQTPAASSEVKAATVAVTKPAVKAAAVGEQEHPHVPGAHGGIIIPIGSDSYHAEAVIEKDGTFRLLMLGADETRIQEVDVQSVKAYVKAAGESDATPIDMKATPQDGDADGKTSQFVGKLPDAAVGVAVDVTIPNLRIGGERFRVGFTTAVQQHDSGMPAAVTGTEEQKLYFTPGGKYAQADIEANGKLSAGQKFRGFMSKHDMSPQPGDFICPVTFTKANPKIEWTVGGKKYLFCCPPCVDEFVRMAKEVPSEVKGPEDYIQKPSDSGTAAKTKSAESATATPSEDPEVTEALATLSQEDRALAKSQKFCAVQTDSLLGSMGKPIKIDVKGQSVFLCCKGCKTKAMNDSEATLAAVAKLKASNTR